MLLIYSSWIITPYEVELRVIFMSLCTEKRDAVRKSELRFSTKTLVLCKGHGLLFLPLLLLFLSVCVYIYLLNPTIYTSLKGNSYHSYLKKYQLNSLFSNLNLLCFYSGGNMASQNQNVNVLAWLVSWGAILRCYISLANTCFDNVSQC